MRIGFFQTVTEYQPNYESGEEFQRSRPVDAPVKVGDRVSMGGDEDRWIVLQVNSYTPEVAGEVEAIDLCQVARVDLPVPSINEWVASHPEPGEYLFIAQDEQGNELTIGNVYRDTPPGDVYQWYIGTNAPYPKILIVRRLSVPIAV